MPTPCQVRSRAVGLFQKSSGFLRKVFMQDKGTR
ncbi:hypothetical protein EDC27_0529 [Desulfosoma caldarium]|uniref:Uncharacterized protein n=1 Tax=Desulfosoma caldarium TaxID=610254 RepID=A0A3N1VKC1_9BACT|nr:hypothetical protein EDC27_0529 [Desulfosoma caldarium]